MLANLKSRNSEPKYKANKNSVEISKERGHAKEDRRINQSSTSNRFRKQVEIKRGNQAIQKYVQKKKNRQPSSKKNMRPVKSYYTKSESNKLTYLISEKTKNPQILSNFNNRFYKKNNNCN